MQTTGSHMITAWKIKDPRVAAVVALAVLGRVACYGFIPERYESWW